MTEREALKLALEALEEQVRMANGWQSPAEAKAITAIKKALALPETDWERVARIKEEMLRVSFEDNKRLKEALAQPEQEPKCVAVVEVFGKDWRLDFMSLPVGKHKLYAQQYTYTAPRKPLTDEDKERLANAWFAKDGDTDVAYRKAVELIDAIEAAHGIKD